MYQLSISGVISNNDGDVIQSVGTTVPFNVTLPEPGPATYGPTPSSVPGAPAGLTLQITGATDANTCNGVISARLYYQNAVGKYSINLYPDLLRANSMGYINGGESSPTFTWGSETPAMGFLAMPGDGVGSSIAVTGSTSGTDPQGDSPTDGFTLDFFIVLPRN